MALPLTYNFRNVLVRWRATLATILGIGMVVAVFVLVQALAVGLQGLHLRENGPQLGSALHGLGRRGGLRLRGGNHRRYHTRATGRNLNV